MIKFNLKEILEHQNKTRYWLSKATGLDKNTINKIYNNESKQIELGTIERLLSALNVDISDLITYEQEER